MAHAPNTANTAVIIEDDPDVRSVLDEVFRSAGFTTVLAPSGLNGVVAVEEHQPAITTLDINLSGIDGFETARRIRAVSSTHIIMISALAEETDIVLGLGSGADDYLTKPFRPRELRARIEAVMRRPQPLKTPVASRVSSPRATARNPSSSASVPRDTPDAQQSWYAHRDIRVDLNTRTVLVAQKEADLSPTEFELLATLLESKRRVRSKSDLALMLRGEANGTSFYVGEADKREIEAHIATLRRKIGDNSVEPVYIETVRGVGYRLTPQSD